MTAWLVLGGCVAENDSACGPNQVFEAESSVLEFAVCLCDASKGYVFDTAKGYGCKKCPKGEEPVDGVCEAPGSGGDGGAGDSGTYEPTGLGEPCASSDDCAGFDASYCDTLQTNTCMVNDCASGNNACGSTQACCDYSALLPDFSICVSEDDLDSGNCPMGGVKVEP